MTSHGERIFLNLRVTEAELVCDNVRSLVLRRPSGEDLPPWHPGAHIDIVVEGGGLRQYSLCGDPADRGSYKIAVLRESGGRGGSEWIHDHVPVGAVLQVRSPRNHFAVEEADGFTFVAGGIGITPIMAMARELSQTERPWQLIYAGRSRSTMAFLNDLSGYGQHLRVLAEDEVGRPDVRELVAGLQDGHLLYVCGPSSMVEAFSSAAEAIGKSGQIRYELFAAVASDADDDLGAPFEVELQRSGMRISVPPTSTILREVRSAGVQVLSDCQDGICGSCETPIIVGEADHRDHVLTPAEQEANDTMMICVSRCRGERLVLDL